MIRYHGGAEPEYLAASDVLIGDMSNINYEFLLFDRPVILLSNAWLNGAFPDIGIKTGIESLGKSIERSISNPNEYRKVRSYWLENTIAYADTSSSAQYIDIALKHCGHLNPTFFLVHGGDAVRKTNIAPLATELVSRNLPFKEITTTDSIPKNNDERVIIAAHTKDLLKPTSGYKIHIDHDLKGIATANLEYARKYYKKNHFFPMIDLHITAGIAGDLRTKLVLGPHANRTVIGGYPKADSLKRFNNKANKLKICNKLDLNPSLPLITYAPAGPTSYMKPGGSLSKQTLNTLSRLAESDEFNILIKVKYKKSITDSIRELLKLTMLWRRTTDTGETWKNLKRKIEK